MLQNIFNTFSAICLFFGRVAAEPVVSSQNGINMIPVSVPLQPITALLPDNGSGIEVFDETLEKVREAGKNAIARFEKKTGLKFNDIYSDDLDPENDVWIALSNGYNKAKGTDAEMLILLLVSERIYLLDDATYPAFLSAWKKHPKRWESFLMYDSGILNNEYRRAVLIAKKPEEKRAILLWLIPEYQNFIAQLESINTKDWENSKTLQRWYQYIKEVEGGRPTALKKPRDILPTYAYAVHNWMYTVLELVKEKLCTVAEGVVMLKQTRATCESALKKEPTSEYAKNIREVLNEELPKLENDLTAHPELWPKDLPKWDGKPAWEIKIEGE